MTTLYSYWRSSASYRVRIALNLKGLPHDIIPVNLLTSEQKGAAYQRINPQGRVPALSDGGHTVTQSLAIIEYLEETHPAPPLLPTTPIERARVRAIAQAIACDISPMANLGPMKYLSDVLRITEAQKTAWIRHWISQGFHAVEAMLQDSGTFCHGAAAGMADCFLIPQVYNARRFNVDLTPFPAIVRIDAACAKLPAFQKAHPAQQKDAL